MSKYIVDGTDLTGIADAIRSQSGKTAQITFPTGFVSEINNLEVHPFTSVTASFPSSMHILTPNEQFLAYTITINGMQGIRRFTFTSGWDNDNIIYSYSQTLSNNTVTFKLYLYNNSSNQYIISANKYTASLYYYK